MLDDLLADGPEKRCAEPRLSGLRERMARDPESVPLEDAGAVGRHIVGCRACLEKSLRRLREGGDPWIAF